MKLLIADDDRMTRFSLTAYLREKNIEVAEACDGLEAVERLRSEDFDVLLLDLRMPGLTGYQVLSWLEVFDPECRIRVIVLSGFICEPAELERHPHVVAVQEKPLYVEDLLKILARCDVPARMTA